MLKKNSCLWPMTDSDLHNVYPSCTGIHVLKFGNHPENIGVQQMFAVNQDFAVIVYKGIMVCLIACCHSCIVHACKLGNTLYTGVEQ